MKRAAALLISVFLVLHSTFAFEGRISATFSKGGDEQHLLFTVGTNCLRVERLETNSPHAQDILNLQTKEMTLLFPNNQSFIRFKPVAENATSPEMLPMNPPPGIGARPGNSPGMPAMPVMMQKMELVQTNGTTNILGFACSRYELKQRGQVMEIWATDKLFPFQPYLENQPHRFGPRMIEEQWGGLVAEKHLFPLLAVSRFENGPERMRWKVTAITPENIKEEDQARFFEPPPEYQEIQPLPF